jgi:ElaB/YqjD/DUF883 family membrane-anchored ribosome-binding protein
MAQRMDEAAQQQGLADQAPGKVHEAARVAQDKASELREHGSARLRDQFDQRSNEAGSQVRSLADALRRGGTDLSNEGNTQAAQLARRAADRVERLGTYLEQKSSDEVMRDVESYARTRPWMLAGLGMLAGVAAARFMKASSEQRYGDYRQTNGPARKGLTRGGAGALDRLDARPGGYIDEPLRDASSTASSDDALARDPYAGTR